MKATDLTGMRFGKLVVLNRYGYHITQGGFKRITWLCKCDCGKTKVALGHDLKRGHTLSCGCNYKNNGKNKGKHRKLFNEYREQGDTIFIKVGDKEAIIDKEDLNKIYPIPIRISEQGYVVCKKSTKLHRLITECPRNLEVDHINHNKLDNRKCNLRCVTKSVNQLNRKITSNTGEFGIRQVSKSRYEVVIDSKYIGSAGKLEEAIAIRNKALKGTKQQKYNFYLRDCL